MRRLYSPVVARSKTLYHPADPVAYACIQLIFIRHGSAIALSEFGEQAVSFGDVIVLGANTLCGGEPEGSATVTALCLDCFAPGLMEALIAGKGDESHGSTEEVQR